MDRDAVFGITILSKAGVYMITVLLLRSFQNNKSFIALLHKSPKNITPEVISVKDELRRSMAFYYYEKTGI